MSLGNYIRHLRKSHRFTLQQLAQRVDADAGNLSRIERGELGISENLLRKIAAAFETTPATLYAESDTAQTTPVPAQLAYNNAVQNNSQEFVQWFRSATPYIHAFGGKTFVIAFGGEIVDEKQFTTLTHDLNLLASLEVRLVLVHGARPQIEQRLKRAQLTPLLHNGLRVTDDEAMEAVKEANGAVKVEIEALLSMGIANSPMAGADIRVASGNFVTAKPIGVIDGVDLQHTGEVRKVNAAGIQKRLNEGELVLVSPLGYSPTGEIFNLSLEDVAVSTAIALDADKLIFLMDSEGVQNLRGELLREMTAEKAKNLLRNVQNSEEPIHISDDIKYYLPAAIHACEHGVARVHLISRHVDGAILQELFTMEGIGTMVTELPLETMRQATIDDVGGILKLIEPLENEGILVRRGRERIEMEINHFYVMEHDNRIIGCAALYPFIEERAAEFACLAIDQAYRGGGRGDKLFDYCAMQAKALGFKTLFCLTTRTEHWFLERGFTEQSVDKLPVEKQQLYNFQRKSKVFSKTL
ncbi:MAG: amino-acid N-acetyltransferase [Methylotenera sp.]|nr:amino-acid N-acetyltransferase [Methylotenera sp.]HOY87131.1 amino-acid N-acetyltransferase [Methylotenera sp.]HPH07519.1 amino-acid N-acetyltransferase [Methylotenera sp.]HPM49182.1 amino-acid N-acetyltransferase [Methylotenera sp.]